MLQAFGMLQALAELQASAVQSSMIPFRPHEQHRNPVNDSFCAFLCASTMLQASCDLSKRACPKHPRCIKHPACIEHRQHNRICHSGGVQMSAKAKVWMPLLIGDYLGDTSHLTTCEHGAYLLLIMHQWRQGHMREQDLRRVARMDPDAWSIAEASVKHLLSIDENGLFYSRKCDRLKEEWLGKSERAHEKAKKAAESRWNRVRERRQAEAMLQALPEQCPSSSSGTTPPLSAIAPSGGGGAIAKAPPPPGGEGLAIAREDAPSMPANGHRPRSRQAHGKRRAKVQEIGQNRPFAASLRPPARVRAKTVQAARNVAGNGHGGPSLVEVVSGIAGAVEDPRFQSFRNLLMKYHSDINGDRSGEHAWSIKADQALAAALERDPGMGESDLIRCLEHRVDAIRICSEHPPRKGVVSARDTFANVINQLPYFKHYPADAFGNRLA